LKELEHDDVFPAASVAFAENVVVASAETVVEIPGLAKWAAESV
jgi:hypothetical protein